MALPQDLISLDLDAFGLPRIWWSSPNLASSRTLDDDTFGLPLVSQDEQILLAAANFTFVPQEIKARASYRDFPNKPFEQQQESQVKQIVPYPPAQYPLT